MTFRDVERGVAKLCPKTRESGDRLFYIYCDLDHMVGWTKVSRKPGKHLGDLEYVIPRQLNVTHALLSDICACVKSRPEYLAAVGHSHEA